MRVDTISASKRGELVYKFPRSTILCGDVASLVKAHEFCFVCVDMEAFTTYCLFQTMQQDWARVGVFTRNAMLSALSASVIVCVGYLLFLAFASVKQFSFIKPIDVLSMYPRHIINRYEVNVPPCNIVKVSELLLSCFYIASLWLQRFLKGDRMEKVFGPSTLCVWSQMPWRSPQIIVSH